MEAKAKRLGRLALDKIVFFQCDIQTFFKDYTYGMAGVIDTAKMMAKASQVFEAPLIETEQVPKVFGRTFPEIKECQGDNVISVEKHVFSMYQGEVKSFLKEHENMTQVVLYGIEAHVCIQQTALDLLENG